MKLSSQYSRLLVRGAIALVFASTANAATFEFSTLIQAGIAGAGNWEIGVGNAPGSPDVTASLGTHWANNVDRLVEMNYQKATNTLSVRVYDGNVVSGSFTQASFQPAGGNLVASNAIWTLPASSFFATASAGPILPTSVTVSNITLGGAINVIQPVQQTTLAASRGFLGGTSTVSQSQDIVFQTTGTGDWTLSANVVMTGLFPLFGASGNGLTFGLTASATDPVPEPGTLGLTMVGGLLMFAVGRYRTRKPASPRV